MTNTAGDFAKGELCERFGIQPRDLRKLDSGVPTVVPTILVRRAAILVSPYPDSPSDMLTSSYLVHDPPSTRCHYSERGLSIRFCWFRGQVRLFCRCNSSHTHIAYFPSWLKGAFIWNLEVSSIPLFDDPLLTLRSQYVLRTSTKAAHGLPYEFRALEACLNSVTYALETEMINIRKLVVDLLDGLEDHIGELAVVIS